MLRVHLFRAHQQLFEGRATQVILPSEAGEISVLAFHAPMVCTLEHGVVQIDETHIPVRHGIACVGRNIVTIVAY